MTKRRYLSPKEKLLVRQRQRNLCACCGEPLESGVHYDHVIGLHIEGTNDLSNFQALKPRHQMKKTIRELKARAKCARIQEQGGLMRKKKSRADKAMAKILERKTA